jgi:hypothetical protein
MLASACRRVNRSQASGHLDRPHPMNGGGTAETTER